MNERLKRLFTGKNGNTVLLLVSIAVSILVLAVIFTVGPLVGYNVENSAVIPHHSVSGDTAVANAWNINNTGMTNGTELWSQNTPMLAVAALIAIVGVIIAILMGVAKPEG